MLRNNRIRTALLAGAAVFVLLPAANAVPSADSKIQALQEQIRLLNESVEELKREQTEKADLEAAIIDLKQRNVQQITEIQKEREKDIQVSLKNGRPTFKTADGNFSASLRALIQYDNAYYAQGQAPAGTDFSSGNNFRRARIGLSGNLFKDWSYQLLYELGGSGSEGAGISQAYVQYDGLGPVKVRLGAFPPAANFDDSTAAHETLFLERAQPTDLGRSLAGADGRAALQVFAYDKDYFVSLAYTGGTAGSTGFFDEQQALVGRAAYRLFGSDDANLYVGADSSYIFRIGDTGAGTPGSRPVRLRARPELNVDNQSIRLIDTGNIDSESLWEWGLEAAGNWNNLYAQGGYFNFDVKRRNSLLPNPSFDGWYVQASWVLTGETRSYKEDRGAYAAPSPSDPLSSSSGGIGAWELAGRYSVLDLNDNAGSAGSATPFGGIRGGRQEIWTAGLNWFPNNAISFQLNYQHTNVSRLDAFGGSTGAKLDTISLRSALSL